MSEGGYESDFTRFCLTGRNKLLGIFEGILRSSNVSLSGEMIGISASIGFDFSKLEKQEISLDQFNLIAMELLKKNHDIHRAYRFVDELVFSKLDAQDDEVRVRAAMVRDIFRTTRTMNNFFIKMTWTFT
ncbi:hypothetical protein [Ruegeria sp. HKCCD7255]|uniref:hypothetical protein n=1 Tax=Ruegeria sp. HKCCD7255 TaxID=2683004 RepID=UPI0014899896|nr:hypothetical protein [Ruegeria sp. HKCCD7255]